MGAGNRRGDGRDRTYMTSSMYQIIIKMIIWGRELLTALTAVEKTVF
jgi:hypothetical protein